MQNGIPYFLRKWFHDQAWPMSVERLIRLALYVLGILVLLFNVTAIFRMHEFHHNDLDVSLRAHAVRLADAVNLERALLLTYTPEDGAAPAYRRMCSQFADYGKAYPHAHSAYSFGYDGNHFLAGPHGFDASHPYFRAPGVIYDDLPEAAVFVFRNRQSVVTEPYEKQGRTIISAFAPVIDPHTGQVCMAIGVDAVYEAWGMQWFLPHVLLTAEAVAVFLLFALGVALLAWRKRQRESIRERWKHLETLLFLGFLLALTLTMGIENYSNESRERGRIFQQVAHSQAEALSKSLKKIRYDMEMVKQYFKSSDFVSCEEFQYFVGKITRNMRDKAIAWAPRVSHAERAVHESMDEDMCSHAPFVWRIDASGERVPEADLEEYHPLRYVSPLQFTEVLAGLNLSGSQEVRDVMRIAQEASFLSATEPGKYLGLLDVRNSVGEASAALTPTGSTLPEEVLVLLSIGDNALSMPEVPGSSEHSRRRQDGFIAASVNVQSLLDRTLSTVIEHEIPGTATHLLDISSDAHPICMARYPHEEMGRSGKYQHYFPSDSVYSFVQPVFAFGKTYLAVVQARDAFFAAHPMRATMLVAVFGTLFSLSITLLIGLLRVFLGRLEQQVIARTAALDERDVHLRAILESTDDGMLALAHNGAVLWANTKFETMWRLEPGQLLALARSPERVMHLLYDALTRLVDADMNFWEELQSATQSDAPSRHELRLRDGRVLERQSTPIFRDLLNVGHLWIFRDITEKKFAEEKRALFEQQLQQTQKLESLGVLAGGIAHDFNNILMAVLGYAELALDDLPTASPVRSSIDEIQIAARRAAELCSQMLAYSGKPTLSMENLALDGIISELMHLLKTVISKKALLTVHMDPELPRIHADPTQLRQVIMNLVINASDALGEYTGAIAITADTVVCDESFFTHCYFSAPQCRPGAYVRLEIVDSGCGMSEETQRRLFEPFYSTKFTGRGLGMAAVMGIVRAHAGAIVLKSKPGAGTTFQVYFPALELVPDPQSSHGKNALPRWRGQGRVLLVEDEDSVRNVGALLLERLGLEATTAANGVEAVELYREHGAEYALVILDLTMPVMNGEEAYEAIMELNPDARIIIASGFTETDIRERFRGKKLAAAIQKPYTMKKMAEILASVLESSQG